MYWNCHRAHMVRIENSMCLAVDAEHLDFITYMTQYEMQEATSDINA